MCMGCAGIVMLSNDGKAPDTTETIVYFAVFALWIVMLTHFKKKWFVKPDANSTQSNRFIGHVRKYSKRFICIAFLIAAAIYHILTI